ncbi:MAG: shikimate kinase [Robiginitomaculum sp.]|nr:MAG: shikimate kinase [Robiginitomaculum sp.]
MIVLVGLMGAGKTTIGRRLAHALHVPFFDADEEIEKSAGRSVEDIFADFGEAAFRDGERKVIERLLGGSSGVLATGGGAFMDTATRAIICEKGLSIWLHADLDVLMERVSLRNTRPLLRQPNPRQIMQTLMETRYPTYAQADIRVESGVETHNHAVEHIISALKSRQNKE